MTYKNPKAYAWRLLSMLIRLRDANENGMITCCSCGKEIFWREADAGHFEPKGTGAKGKALEFYERNIHAQCGTCNRNQGYNRARKEQIKINYSVFMMKKYGEGIFDELERVENTVTHLKSYHWVALIQEYKKRLAKFKLYKP